MLLDDNFRFFLKNRNTIEKLYYNKVVVICNSIILKAFTDLLDAISFVVESNITEKVLVQVVNGDTNFKQLIVNAGL